MTTVTESNIYFHGQDKILSKIKMQQSRHSEFFLENPGRRVGSWAGLRAQPPETPADPSLHHVLPPHNYVTFRDGEHENL